MYAFAVAAADQNILIPLTPGTRRIPRESGLSLSDFHERYAERQRPVIITDYASCFSQMTRTNIDQICGEKLVDIAQKAKKTKEWAGIVYAPSQVTLHQALNDPTGSNPSAVGVWDLRLSSFCPELLDSHYTVPKYVAQDFLQRVPGTRPLLYRDSWPSLFVGANSSYGGLHRDVFGSAFWQYVISGTKEWHIMDSIIGEDLFERNAALTHYHDMVQAGELLLIPGNAQHQVRNLGATLSLAGNYISRGSMRTLNAEMEEARKDPEGLGQYYRQLDESILRQGFNTTIDYEWGKHDLNYSQFKAQAERFPASLALSDLSQAPETLEFLVQGAGSEACNGRYVYSGYDEGGHEYMLDSSTATRRFLLFRAAMSEWWNIALHENGEYKVYYGAAKSPLEDDLEMPPASTAAQQWKNWKPGKWLGEEPAPILQRKSNPKQAVGSGLDRGHHNNDNASANGPTHEEI
jgi:hypothetical protein